MRSESRAPGLAVSMRIESPDGPMTKVALPPSTSTMYIVSVLADRDCARAPADSIARAQSTVATGQAGERAQRRMREIMAAMFGDRLPSDSDAAAPVLDSPRTGRTRSPRGLCRRRVLDDRAHELAVLVAGEPSGHRRARDPCADDFAGGRRTAGARAGAASRVEVSARVPRR